MAAAADELYRAQATVTGQGEANRVIGFASCLEDVLIKVSGAQQLGGDRRLAAYKSNAKGFVRAFSYRDQMSGTPTRDEQGRRETCRLQQAILHLAPGALKNSFNERV